MTASIGIACFSDGDRLTGEEIMVNADLAMYEAKENGRNRTAQYGTEEHERPRIESQHEMGERDHPRTRRGPLRALRPADQVPACQRPHPVRAAAAHARPPRRPHSSRHLPLHCRAARDDPGDRSLGRGPRDRHARRATRLRPRPALRGQPVRAHDRRPGGTRADRAAPTGDRASRPTG